MVDFIRKDFSTRQHRRETPQNRNEPMVDVPERSKSRSQWWSFGDKQKRPKNSQKIPKKNPRDQKNPNRLDSYRVSGERSEEWCRPWFTPTVGRLNVQSGGFRGKGKSILTQSRRNGRVTDPVTTTSPLLVPGYPPSFPIHRTVLLYRRTVRKVRSRPCDVTGYL